MDGTITRLRRVSYAQGIRDAFQYLLANYPNCFAIGQGLWSPWYVGASMQDLDKEFGTDRVIDTPVSELACTGAALGASLCGYRPIVVHPRMDFMLLAVDQIVNQAAKWSHMLGGRVSPAMTIRGIINRGGEQGAQHSQALHAWFAHIPGIRVVMPSTPRDARDLLVASVLCDQPVLYIDNRWLYDQFEDMGDIAELPLEHEGPKIRRHGDDITLVGSGYAAHLCEQAADELVFEGVSAEVIDVRVLNPFDPSLMTNSVAKTGRLFVVDDGWQTCGLAGEIIAAVTETLDPDKLKARPARQTLPNAPAPTSKALEARYYLTASDVADGAFAVFGQGPRRLRRTA